MTLTEFLLARIEDDEAIAGSIRANDEIPAEWRDFLAAPFAARVLAECEAKRRIVQLHTEEFFTFNNPCPTRKAVSFEGEATLRLLALPYACHPDYRDEWRMS